jgi:hypothetical protein
MSKDAVQTLEETRQKLIKKLLEKRDNIEAQLKALNYDDKKPR